MNRVVKIVVISVFSLTMVGCSVIRAAGDTVEATGDGVGHAVEETGDAVGRATHEMTH